MPHQEVKIVLYSILHHHTCSNNQAEQLAIVKAMETIKELHIADNVPREITIHR